MMMDEYTMDNPADRLGAIAAVVVLVAAVGLGCEADEEVDDPDDVGATDTGEDVADDVAEPDEPFEIDDPYELVPFQEGVDREDGHEAIGEGTPGDDEVRVGRIQDDDTGFVGIWSHCRSGDFLIANSEIEVCVQEESTNRLEVYTGGKLVDARRQKTDRSAEQTLDVVMPLVDSISTARAESVEVVRDGSDDLAVLRVTGEDVDLALLSGTMSQRMPEPEGITVETEYRLLPGSEVVEIVTLFTPPGAAERSYQIGDWFGYGDRAQPWTPREGWGAATSQMPWLGAVDEEWHHSYGLIFEDTAAPLGIVDQFDVPWREFRAEDLAMSGDDPSAYRRWFAVGDGTIDSIRSLAAQVRNEDFDDSEATVSVVDEAGEPVQGVRLVVYDGDEAITGGKTDEAGEAELAVGPGDYRVVVDQIAGPIEWERDIEIADGDAEVTVPELTQLTFDIRESGSGEHVSARVVFEHDDVGRWFEYATQGTLSTTVPAGELTYGVHRGMEYDMYRQTTDFEAGDSHELDVELVRGVDTEGWISGDFHQHLEPSFDSRLHVEARIKENVTQGVELAVPTDHDVVTDLEPKIEELGLGDEIASFPGVEISPLYAHYNLYPVPYEPGQRGRGTIPLAQGQFDQGGVHLPRMPEIIDEARNFETDPVVQMNHPRRDTSGMLEYVDFDPEADPATNDHEDLVLDIDTIEVINSYSRVCQTLADWSGLLNAGRRVTGLGNSDSHDPDAEAGVPRNYLPLDLEPAEIEADPVREALRDGRATVGSHAYLELGDGVRPGDEIAIDEGGETVGFDVSVQTPDWAVADTLFVIVNGEVVDEIEGTADENDRYDFDETVDVEVDDDAWVVFWADGPEPTAPVPRSRRVIGFSNPVYIKTGDQWSAPGAGELDLAAIDTGYCD